MLYSDCEIPKRTYSKGVDKMEFINNFYHDIYDAEHQFFEQDEAYQAAKGARDKLEDNLLSALTRKQRLLFHQYKAQQEALITMELHRLFSHCSILLAPKTK